MDNVSHKFDKHQFPANGLDYYVLFHDDDNLFLLILRCSLASLVNNHHSIEPCNMVQQNPDRFCCCPLCDIPLAKKSMRSHLKSDVCKDNHYHRKAAQEVLANIEDSEINDIMVEFYANNEPHEVANVPIEEEPPAHWQ